MSDNQFMTLVGLIMTSIIINVTIVGFSQKSTNKRIDDVHKRIDDLADDIRAIREDIRLIVNKLIPDEKMKK